MALLVPEHGYVGPAPLVDALVRAATARGVSMVQRAWRRTSTRSDADAIVIAAGSWSAEFVKTPAVREANPRAAAGVIDEPAARDPRRLGN